MMNKMCMAAIIAASLYAGTTFAQPAAVKKIIETGQTDNRVMHQLDILTNRFGGRVIGSDINDGVLMYAWKKLENCR